MIKLKFYQLIFLEMLCLASCSIDRDPCLLPKTTSIRVGAYQVIDSSKAVVDSLLPRPIWIAIVSDSLKGLLYPAKTSKFSLLLSPIDDSCRYILQPDSAINSFDTVIFHYQRRLQFLSNACGYTYFFNLTQIRTTFQNIDSIIINNAEVNSDANTPEHVQIFL